MTKKVIKYIKANLFDELDKVTEPTVIPHVCNNEWIMGAGIAAALAKEFPQVYSQYKKEKPPLGTTQFVRISAYDDPPTAVANMVAQTLFSKEEWAKQSHRLEADIPLKYEHLVHCMVQVRETCLKTQCNILTVRFGSGLACGNPLFIEALVKEIWKDLNVTVCEL